MFVTVEPDPSLSFIVLVSEFQNCCPYSVSIDSTIKIWHDWIRNLMNNTENKYPIYEDICDHRCVLFDLTSCHQK
jgi:hypothetical protein